jgi:hypothetical protein
VGDFHKLDRFGEIVFGDEKGEVPAAKAVVTDEKAVKVDKAGKAAKPETDKAKSGAKATKSEAPKK